MKTTFAWMAAAVLLGSLSAGTTLAAERGTQRYEMIAPVRSPDGDARGSVKIRHRRKGATTVVRLKGLTPRESYEVRDGDTDELLGTVRANRKGKARLKVRHRQPRAPGKAATTSAATPEAIVVREADSQLVVLMGDDDGATVAEAFDAFRFGDGFHGTMAGANVQISLFADADGRGDMSFCLSALIDGSGRYHYELIAGTPNGLPEGADAMDDVAGKPFEIRDGKDTLVLAGDLPRLLSLSDLILGDAGFELPPAGGQDDEIEFEPPFTLLVAVDGETFVDGGTFAESYAEDSVFGGITDYAYLAFGSLQGVNGSITLSGDAASACLAVSMNVPGEDGITGHSYGASRYGDLGTLPGGAQTLQELAGRALQIRDSQGTVIVEREIPDLADSGAFWGTELDGADLTAGVAPYSVWVEDGSGALVLAGQMIEFDPQGYGGGWWDPDFLYAGAFYGAYFGDNGSLSMSSDEGADLLSFSLFLTDGSLFGGEVHQFIASNTGQGDPLPFGAARVGDLSGRAFEIRNAAGTAIISDTLPELETDNVLGDPDGPLFPDGDPMLPPGDGPFSIWIEDDAGVLTRVAALEDLGSVF